MSMERSIGLTAPAPTMADLAGKHAAGVPTADISACTQKPSSPQVQNIAAVDKTKTDQEEDKEDSPDADHATHREVLATTSDVVPVTTPTDQEQIDTQKLVTAAADNPKSAHRDDDSTDATMQGPPYSWPHRVWG